LRIRLLAREAMKKKKKEEIKRVYHPGPRPTEPKEHFPKRKTFLEGMTCYGESSIPEGADYFALENNYGDVEIQFYKLEAAQPNPNYSIEKATYLKKLKKWEKDLKNWEDYQEKLRLDILKEQEEQEIAQYKKLKEKYGDRV
jgi:hypothetical protein